MQPAPSTWEAEAPSRFYSVSNWREQLPRLLNLHLQRRYYRRPPLVRIQFSSHFRNLPSQKLAPCSALCCRARLFVQPRMGYEFSVNVSLSASPGRSTRRLSGLTSTSSEIFRRRVTWVFLVWCLYVFRRLDDRVCSFTSATCPGGMSKFCSAGTLGAAQGGSCRVLNCSANEHATGLPQCLRKLGCDPHSVTLAGFRGGGATDHWLNLPALRRHGRRSNEKTLERYVQEGVYFLQLDRARCYAHWQCLLRRSSPLWSLVSRSSFAQTSSRLRCWLHVSIPCPPPSKQKHPPSSLHSYVPSVTLPWCPRRWLRCGVACLQRRAI